MQQGRQREDEWKLNTDGCAIFHNRELTHGRIDDEILKEKLLEFTVISVCMLQGDENAASRSQQQSPAQTRRELAARARSELRRRSDVPEIDPISGTADAVRAKSAEGPPGKSNEDQP